MSSENIYQACRKGHVDRVRQYLVKGGCVTETDGNKMTMLHHLAFSGNEELVKLLLESQQQCIDLDAADSDGWTPLHFAADRGHASVCLTLLDEGANVCSRDSNKRTPLHLAATGNHLEVARVLLAHGASKTSKNIAGMTPLDCAKSGSQCDEWINLFE